MHYIPLNIADQEYNVDAYYSAQPNWYQEEIDIAFQMDGNYAQQPYGVLAGSSQLVNKLKWS